MPDEIPMVLVITAEATVTKGPGNPEESEEK
jgi:hypothetical protein